MEEDITCKFLATTTMLKGVFIFLNSIFVRGYFTSFFFFPFQRAADGWAESLTFSQHTSQQLHHVFPRENGKHFALIQIIATSFTPAKEWTSIRTMMSYTLPQGCWSVTFSEMLQHRFSISFLHYTYNLSFSIYVICSFFFQAINVI